MKVMTLNSWGGRAGKKQLLDFFRVHKDDIDIFCLQEVWAAPYEHLEGHAAGGKAIEHDAILTEGLQEISAVLDTYIPYFAPHYGDNYGLLTLVHKRLPVLEHGEIYVHLEKGALVTDREGEIGNHARNIHYVTVQTEVGRRTIMNFHGLWNGKGKGDGEDRLAQSRRIVSFLETIQDPYVLCGDFNLLPETESLKMLERLGLRNLVREYGITSTRSSFYTKDVKFADYVLTSPGVVVRDFTVLPDEISDHLPLVVDFI